MVWVLFYGTFNKDFFVITADIVSKAYNKSQKDLTADSVHAPRTFHIACWKARLLEGSICDVLTLVLKMSKQVL